MGFQRPLTALYAGVFGPVDTDGGQHHQHALLIVAATPDNRCLAYWTWLIRLSYTALRSWGMEDTHAFPCTLDASLKALS
jgi:hypothetical protein